MLKINFKTLTITSLIGGFLLIPLHELGHVVCDWITGHPAAMSYARDYLLSGGKTPFLGLLGGPLFPLILSTVSVILIYRGSHLSVSYPLAVLGTFDRLLLYLSGSTPSDERELARAIGWPTTAFKHIFLAAEILVLVLVLLSLIRYKAGIRRSALIFVIPLASFVICASFGVFVVDRFLFPKQHKIEFGLTLPHSHTIGGLNLPPGTQTSVITRPRGLLARVVGLPDMLILVPTLPIPGYQDPFQFAASPLGSALNPGPGHATIDITAVI